MNEAWLGVLAYALQLYFDFSGYSDMAIGLARLFGIRLPMNFNSPYQATSIADFWRRWHMTLSRFLRDYVYIPVGGNRHGPGRKYLNLFLTMLIGGIWHGAGWTFVIWGALHGLYLLGYHVWRDRRENLQRPTSNIQRSSKSQARMQSRARSMLGIVGARGLTFLLVALAWIFFRAESLGAAMNILTSLTGVHGFMSNWSRVHMNTGWVTVGFLLPFVWLLPNSHQLLARFQPTLEYLVGDRNVVHAEPRWFSRFLWQPRRAWALAVAMLAVASVLGLSRISEFIYWQF
jgi:D-alanyl-lipoteichoic acid acyltransferase DltB (MBOAT superfamily)